MKKITVQIALMFFLSVCEASTIKQIYCVSSSENQIFLLVLVTQEDGEDFWHLYNTQGDHLCILEPPQLEGSIITTIIENQYYLLRLQLLFLGQLDDGKFDFSP